MSLLVPEFPASYRDAQLNIFADELQLGAYPGYPPKNIRLVAEIATLGRTATGAIILPPGDWIVPDRSGKIEASPQPIVTDKLAYAGHSIDSQGRPLHPWLEQMVTDPRLGVLGGKGFYWSWGPNRTADSVIVHDGSMLLIRRNDTGAWALPGGFIDGGEHAARAARREVKEETGVRLDHAWSIPFYKGPVVDRRMTAHAWPETTAYLFPLADDTERPVPHAADDARSAEWVPLEELENLSLFGSHQFLARLALSQLDEVSAQNSQPANR